MPDHINCRNRRVKVIELAEEVAKSLDGCATTRDAIEEVIVDLINDSGGRLAGNVTTVLNILEAQGRLEVVRSEDEAHKTAAYLESDIITLFTRDHDEAIQSHYNERKLMTEHDDHEILDGARVLVEAILEGDEPTVSLGEAICMVAGGKLYELTTQPVDIEPMSIETIVESSDEGYKRGYRQGYRDGFTDSASGA